jgi:threonine synthase
MLRYKSTRGGASDKSFEEVVLEGLAPDGGLYLPDQIPHYSTDFWMNLQGKSFIEVAFTIIQPFVGNCIPHNDLKNMLEKSYGNHNFRNECITPVKKLDNNLHILELFHGPTLAFKDVALQFLGKLFDYLLNKNNETMTIVGATSGDTGSAAIESIRHCKNARIFMLHPYERTSDIQRKQMTHIQADNVFNIAIEGTFDDCQNIVKDLFNDKKFRTQHKLSAVNSINWARIMAQMVYYIYAALQVGAPQKQVRFAVPTGNFGNIFAAYMCKQMGLSIDALIIGSNHNDIITRFFETGTMPLDAVKPSHSPSMDIQISSNFERFLFYAFDQNADMLEQFMQDFKTKGTASVSNDTLHYVRKNFQAYRSTDQDTLDIIHKINQDYNYLCDPHTAVGIHASVQNGMNKDIPTIALACAHPAKFPETVEKAVGFKPKKPSILDHLKNADEHYTTLPASTEQIQKFINLQ